MLPVGIHFYRRQTKLQKGNIFTFVCQSFCSGGGGCRGMCSRGHAWQEGMYARRYA